MKFQYGSVNWMVARLDAEYIAYRKARACDRFFRRIKNPALKRFCQALKHEMVHDPKCHEFNIPKKVSSRLKIGLRMYHKHLAQSSKIIAR